MTFPVPFLLENCFCEMRVSIDCDIRAKLFSSWMWHRITYLLTYSMEESLLEANRLSSGQEIPHILWNPNVHYRIHKCPPHVPEPDQSMPPHPTYWRSVLILSPHLRLGLPSGLFSSGFPTKTLCTPLSPVVLHAPPISFLSLWSPKQYWRNNTDH